MTSDYTVRPYTVSALADRLRPKAWKRRSAGDGSQGPRWYEWALDRMYLDETGWGHWLLIRRASGAPQERAYYRVFAPADTTLEQMVAVAGKRWAVEECFAMAKGECGLDEYEVRSWAGWHRHVTLSLLAHAYLTVVRAQATHTDPHQKKCAEEELLPLTVPEVRVLLGQLVWHQVPPAEFVLDWSRWRRRHQATAKRYSYQQRARAG